MSPFFSHPHDHHLTDAVWCSLPTTPNDTKDPDATKSVVLLESTCVSQTGHRRYQCLRLRPTVDDYHLASRPAQPPTMLLPWSSLADEDFMLQQRPPCVDVPPIAHARPTMVLEAQQQAKPGTRCAASTIACTVRTGLKQVVGNSTMGTP
jgi:hypothetical protein